MTKITPKRKKRLNALYNLAMKNLSAEKYRRPAIVYWENFLYDNNISFSTLIADLRTIAADPTCQIVEKKISRGRFHYYAFKIDYNKLPF